jgi:hypothetical protein
MIKPESALMLVTWDALEGWDISCWFNDPVICGIFLDFNGYSYSAGNCWPIFLLRIFVIIRPCCALELGFG